MKTLLLMRHCQAKSVGDVAGDRHRPLSPGGLAEAKLAAEWLSQTGRLPDGVLCSAALRTRQTAEAIMAACPQSRRVDVEAFYQADDTELRHGIAAEAVSHDLGDVQTLLVLGHNPTISDLAGSLTRRPTMLPPGAIVVIEVDHDWSQPLAAAGCRWIEQWTPGRAAS